MNNNDGGLVVTIMYGYFLRNLCAKQILTKENKLSHYQLPLCSELSGRTRYQAQLRSFGFSICPGQGTKFKSYD